MHASTAARRALTRSSATRARLNNPRDARSPRGLLRRALSQHREEPIHLGLLPRRHVVEVAAAVDDFPELLQLDPRQLIADRLQAFTFFTCHVEGDLLRAILCADRQVVAGELDLRLANALQPGFLLLDAQRLI